LRRTLHVRGRSRFLRLAQLRRAQETVERGFPDGGAFDLGIVHGIFAERDVHVFFSSEARLLAVVELHFAVAAVEIARADSAMLPHEVLQHGAQRMQRLAFGHGQLQCLGWVQRQADAAAASSPIMACSPNLREGFGV